MEVITVVGILAAFCLGAFVRKPFLIAQKEVQSAIIQEKEDKYRKKTKEERRIDQLNNLMNYTGKVEIGEDE